MYSIVAVCTGNICRSPMAELALRRAVETAGLAEHVRIDSAGVSDEELGNPVDPRADELLRREGLDASRHAARVFDPVRFDDRDLVLALDVGHWRRLRALAPDGTTAAKVRLLREFDPAVAHLEPEELGIYDPWYGGPEDFETTYAMIAAAVPGVVRAVARELRAGQQSPEDTAQDAGPGSGQGTVPRPAQDSGWEAPQDAGRDPAQDSGPEARQDAGQDAVQDAGREAPQNAGRDAAQDAGRT
ncbi:low molecular weight protein-tyrosine-phosphatase [Kocuria sp. CPCC 205268]|uniref:low molecular weight protein-tyrosine-phosphatase n=1 Tax=Kocuria oxytropis TaxID=3058913 RepID=UPI0034D7AE8D